MPHLVVCPLSRLEKTASEHDVRDIITLLSPDMLAERPACVPADRHLRLSLHDISADISGMERPAADHVSGMIDFAISWTQEKPLLVHCWMGISRSTAAAYICALSLNPDLDEMEVALELRRRSPSATPNARLIALADEILGRKGRMNAAIKRIGRGRDAREGAPFVLPIK